MDDDVSIDELRRAVEHLHGVPSGCVISNRPVPGVGGSILVFAAARMCLSRTA
jgi:hypothetical protein